MLQTILNRLRRLFTGDKVTSASYDPKTQLMSVTFEDEYTKIYEGDVTVWYEYPMMTRCSTGTEWMLCNLWKYWSQHGNPYPTAHKGKI